MSSDLIQELAVIFKEALPSLKATKQRLSLNGNSFGASGMFKKLFDSIDEATQNKIDNKFGGKFIRDMHGESQCNRLFSSLFNMLNVTSEINLDELFYNNEITTPLSKLNIIINFNNARKMIVYDGMKDKVHTWESKLVMSRLELLLGPNLGAYLASNTLDCRIEYHPYQPRLIKDNDSEQLVFNIWQEAPWRMNWEPDSNAELPADLKEFLGYLFADDESMEKTLAWIRDCIFDRAEPILILVGIQGGGKNILIEHLAANLIGMPNYDKSNKGFARSNFHAGIAGKGLFLFDEVNLSIELRETLKDYHNGFANLEAKNVDASGRKKIHSSFVLAKNFISDIKMSYAERKFFIPNLSKIPLVDKWSKEKIELFIETFKDVKVLQQIASYLFFKYKKNSSAIFPKTKTYEEVCRITFPWAFRQFIHLCHVKEEIKQKDFNKRGQGFRSLDPSLLESLILEYETGFKLPLAELIFDTFGDWKAISKCYDKNKLEKYQEDERLRYEMRKKEAEEKVPKKEASVIKSSKFSFGGANPFSKQ